MSDKIRPIVLVAFLATFCFGDQVVIDATDANPGVTFFRVTVNDDGTVVAEPIDNVVNLKGIKIAVIDVPDVPADRPRNVASDAARKLASGGAPKPAGDRARFPAGDIPEFVALVRDAALDVKGDPDLGKTARVLASAYEAVASAAEAGTIEGVEQLVRGTDAVYRSQIDRERRTRQWQSWKDTIDDRMPPLDNINDGIRAWRDIAAGLRLVNSE